MKRFSTLSVISEIQNKTKKPHMRYGFTHNGCLDSKSEIKTSVVGDQLGAL